MPFNGSGSNLSGAGDVFLSSPSDNQVLGYNATTAKWNNKNPTGGVDATTTSKGLIQLSGDLGGTAASPTVPGLATKIPSSQKAAANGVATLDASSRVPSAQLGAGTASSGKSLMIDGSGTVNWAPAGIPFATVSMPGALATGVVSLPFPVFGTWRFDALLVGVGTAPAGSPLIVDLLYNGASIYGTTPSNRPSVAAGALWASGGTADTTQYVGSTTVRGYVQFSIVQVGSTTAGSDLVATLYATRLA